MGMHPRQVILEVMQSIKVKLILIIRISLSRGLFCAEEMAELGKSFKTESFQVSSSRESSSKQNLHLTGILFIGSVI